jgi:hypothetical protein
MIATLNRSLVALSTVALVTSGADAVGIERERQSFCAAGLEDLDGRVHRGQGLSIELEKGGSLADPGFPSLSSFRPHGILAKALAQPSEPDGIRGPVQSPARTTPAHSRRGLSAPALQLREECSWKPRKQRNRNARTAGSQSRTGTLRCVASSLRTGSIREGNPLRGHTIARSAVADTTRWRTKGNSAPQRDSAVLHPSHARQRENGPEAVCNSAGMAAMRFTGSTGRVPEREK